MDGQKFGYSEPLEVRAFYQPLSVSFQMREVGGSLEQWYYQSGGRYEPDRSSSVLFLVPSLELSDPDTRRTYVPEMEVQWQADGTAITNTSDTQSASYVLRQDGSLMVKKNVAPGTGGIRLYCKVRYVDPLSGDSHTVEWSDSLVTHQKTDNSFIVSVVSESRQYWDPLSGDTPVKTFRAAVQHGGGDAGGQVKFLWYWLDGNDGRPIDTHPAYVSGQGTDTLKVDADYTSTLRMYVMVASDKTLTAPDQPTRGHCQLEWRLPKVKGEARSADGLGRRNGENKKTLNVHVTSGKGDLDDGILKERIAIRWVKVKGTTESLVAWGDGITADVSDAGTGVAYGLRPDLYLLGPLETVTDDVTGEAVTDDDTGEPVFGRTI